MSLSLHDQSFTPRELDYKKKIIRELLFETGDSDFATVIFGTPAYEYDRAEFFVEFDTSTDEEYLGKAFIRWSAVEWLRHSISRKRCDLCGDIAECLECNACEFDLSPFEFTGPCRFQERESRWLCENCTQQVESHIKTAVEENPSIFVAREI